MSAHQSAPQSALHNLHPEDEGHAQVSRARTRDSVPDGGAKVVDLTVRNRARIAATQRWGKPIEEPPPPARQDDDDRAWKPKAALNQLHLWRDPTPSLRAVWHDLKAGGREAYANGGWLLAAGYWALGAPGFPIVVLAKLVEITFARPGRELGFIVVVLLLAVALLIAT